MCESDSLAREMAMQMDDLNKDRKAIETGMQQEAMKMLQNVLSADENSLPWGVCLFDETWHQGVIGILASRIKDKYHRPTIVFADVGDGQIKGVCALDSRVSYPRCAGCNSLAPATAITEIWRPCDGRRNELNAGQFSSICKSL